MKHYRLYFMSSVGGHIDRFESITALDDRDAIRFAKIYTGSAPLELWLEGRMIGTFEAEFTPQDNGGIVPKAMFCRAFAPLLSAHITAADTLPN